jgi:hypothetical protein
MAEEKRTIIYEIEVRGYEKAAEVLERLAGGRRGVYNGHHKEG